MSNINNKREVYIFGDSHCTSFVGAEGNNFKAIVCGHDSASITGLNKLDSRLEYGKHIMHIATYHTRRDGYPYGFMLLKLGQVDVEFIMYYKIYIKKERFTFEEYCRSLIDKYREFINKLLLINKNVIIASINLPAYDDTIIVGNYIARIIKESMTFPKICDDDTVMASIEKIDSELKINLSNLTLQQLTYNFIYFNGLLCELSKELGLLFFDTTSSFIDCDNNILKNEYRYPGHHYKGYNDIIVSDVKNVLCDVFKHFFDNVR